MVTLEELKNRTSANQMTPQHLSHPGAVVKEEMEYVGISQRQLATELQVSHSVLNEVLNGKRPVTVEYALMFEAALGIDSATLIQMQARYNMLKAKKDETFMKKLKGIRKVAASVAL